MSHIHAKIDELRIAQLTTLGLSAKAFLIEHFNRLRSRGAEVILVCTDDKDGKAAADAAGIRFVPIQIEQYMAPLSDLLSLFQLWRLFRRFRPDVVHAHMTKAGLLGITAGWLAGVRVRIYHNHGLALTSAHGLRLHILRATEWLTNRLATHVLFVGDSTRQAAIEFGVSVPGRSQVLGRGTISGVDVEKFAPDPTGARRSAQRRALGVSESTVVVGYVGRLLEEKGIETLIDAWRQLDASIRDLACLLLVGGTTHSEPKMRSIVEEAQRDNIGVKTLGWVEDMAACYGGMDLLVLPSWREGFPYGIVEAQSMKLPIVTTHATGCIDAVQHEDTGLLVPVRDAAALAEALSRLIRSPEERHRFGERGRQRILDDFTQDRVMANMIAFYEEQVVPCVRR